MLHPQPSLVATGVSTHTGRPKVPPQLSTSTMETPLNQGNKNLHHGVDKQPQKPDPTLGVLGVHTRTARKPLGPRAPTLRHHLAISWAPPFVRKTQCPAPWLSLLDAGALPHTWGIQGSSP